MYYAVKEVRIVNKVVGVGLCNAPEGKVALAVYGVEGKGDDTHPIHRCLEGEVALLWILPPRYLWLL